MTLESIEEQRPSQVEVPAAPTSSARGLSFEGPPRPRMPALRPPPAVRACAPPPRPETEPPAAETSLPPPIESAAFPTQHATPEPSVPPAPPSRRPLVLVISMLETDDDELAEGLRAQGFDVLVVDEARAGFEMTCRLAPACIVCDMDLPDDGGDRVVLRLRRLSSPIATTPFVLIASHASTTERASRFSAGADVCLLKPYVASTVVLQVVALHQMSARLRDARSALSRFPQATSRAFQGHLEQISLASILTVIDMERRTGVFGVRHDGFQVELVIISGHATHGFVQGNLVGPLEAMRAIATMSKGRFSFVARDGFAPVPEDAMRLGHVLAEATRLADEATAPATKSELNVRTR
ncbi:MAG: response regulator [Polyangiaceae bacterium]|nr:response regulator [Polyangiaceae bacterium]